MPIVCRNQASAARLVRDASAVATFSQSVYGIVIKSSRNQRKRKETKNEAAAEVVAHLSIMSSSTSSLPFVVQLLIYFLPATVQQRSCLVYCSSAAVVAGCWSEVPAQTPQP